MKRSLFTRKVELENKVEETINMIKAIKDGIKEGIEREKKIRRNGELLDLNVYLKMIAEGKVTKEELVMIKEQQQMRFAKELAKGAVIYVVTTAVGIVISKKLLKK